MSAYGAILAGIHNVMTEEIVTDDQGVITHHWLWPERAEIIYGGIASVLVIGLLVWKAGPLAKKGMEARTARIQEEIDASAQARADAEAEAARIRQALGDVQSERRRLLAEADAHAGAVLADGRARLDEEVAEIAAKADADIAAAAARTSDELRIEIARLAATASEEIVARSLDEELQQRLIEDFISNVGRTSPVGART